MQISERDRHELYEWAREVMGPVRADTFMSYLPPVGWGDVATRRDLDVLRADVRTDMAELRAEMADRFRRQTSLLVSAVAALGGLVLGAVGLVLAAVRYW